MTFPHELDYERAFPPVGTPTREEYRREHRTCGLIGTYVDGCRCDDCRRAAREYRARYRAAAKARALKGERRP